MTDNVVRCKRTIWLLQGLICNSSICMKRRGMQPTGIAIFSAQVTACGSLVHRTASRLELQQYIFAQHQLLGDMRPGGETVILLQHV